MNQVYVAEQGVQRLLTGNVENSASFPATVHQSLSSHLERNAEICAGFMKGPVEESRIIDEIRVVLHCIPAPLLDVPVLRYALHALMMRRLLVRSSSRW